MSGTTSDKPTGTAPWYASFREFYPFYLGQHTNRTSRRLHVTGTLLALLLAVLALALRRWALLWAVPLAGYGFAWVGHLCFERNSPATFAHPLYSLRGDLQMLYEVLRGRRRW
ncbi:MAG: Mpo1-like protein [Steroidobacteraceae bacterium]